MLKSKFTVCILLTAFLVIGCAKRGTVSGGAKDTIPPVLINSDPRNFSTGFKGDFIRINFNEYIKIKDLSKQLIVSPPMKQMPYVVPAGSASKFITIKIFDTLQPNTTYSFNFGQSITDNNEGNPYSQFKYVFSTGSYIDSLKLGGGIKDALSKKTDPFVSIQLYEAETFTDSTVYKTQPRYVTNTLDSAKTFLLENLKEGRYHLIALKDENADYKFNPETEKIAFFKNPVTVPNDTLHQLELFKEELPFKAQKPYQTSATKMIMGFQGKEAKNTKITVQQRGNTVKHYLTRLDQKDSLQIWLPKLSADSLEITVENGKFLKTFVTKTKEMKTTDSLSLKGKQSGSLGFREPFKITSSTPLMTVDNSKIRITKKDSSAVSFTTKYNEFEQELVVDFTKEEDEKYNIHLLPGAVEDFYQNTNDTIKYTVSTKKLSDYGVMKLTLENINRFPILVELLDSKENVIVAQYSEKETILNFEALEPNKYTLRVIYDDDGNKEWTTGNFLEKRQPEAVIYYPDEINVLANWYLEETFILSK